MQAAVAADYILRVGQRALAALAVGALAALIRGMELLAQLTLVAAAAALATQGLAERAAPA